MTKALHTTPKGRGRQHLSKLRDKIYINALQQRDRMTVRQVNDVVGGTHVGTLCTLKGMRELGLICGEQVGKMKVWEFWAHDINPRT